jgi:hypothetical protein
MQERNYQDQGKRNSMEYEARFDPVEVMIQRLVESASIIAPVFQAQYNGVRDELGDMATKSGRSIYSRMRKHF